jgi:hypothetical protein
LSPANIVSLPEEGIMKKIFLIGVAGISLALGMMVVGCTQDTDSGGGGGGSYTFEFRVENFGCGSPISKIEFFNGANDSAPLLHTETVNLTDGQMSSTINVSGFTEKQNDGNHIFGVKVTFSGEVRGENNFFGWSSTANKNKVLVRADYYFAGLYFSDGNW